jgi:hypothetical protein
MCGRSRAGEAEAELTARGSFSISETNSEGTTRRTDNSKILILKLGPERGEESVLEQDSGAAGAWREGS